MEMAEGMSCGEYQEWEDKQGWRRSDGSHLCGAVKFAIKRPAHVNQRLTAVFQRTYSEFHRVEQRFTTGFALGSRLRVTLHDTEIAYWKPSFKSKP